MVIISTRAVEVSIQAVSPELMSVNFTSVGSVGAGAAAAGPAGAALASAAADAVAGAVASSDHDGTGCALNAITSTNAASAVAIARALDNRHCLAVRSTRIT